MNPSMVNQPSAPHGREEEQKGVCSLTWRSIPLAMIWAMSSLWTDVRSLASARTEARPKTAVKGVRSSSVRAKDVREKHVGYSREKLIVGQTQIFH